MLRDPVSDWTVPRLHDLAKTRMPVRDGQLLGTRSPWLQNFVQWWLILVGARCWSFFRDSLLVPRILGWLQDFWNTLAPLVTTFGLTKTLLLSRSASLGHRMRCREL